MTPLGLESLGSAYIEVFRRGDELYDWRLVAGNGEIVCGTNQGFTSRHDAERGASRAKTLFEGVSTEVRQV
jgi:uncharacterized protein YegP (UPF0339 family)